QLPIGEREAPPYLNVKEAAAFLGVPRSWVYEHVRSGELPSKKAGRYIRFLRKDLQSYMENPPAIPISIAHRAKRRYTSGIQRCAAQNSKRSAGSSGGRSAGSLRRSASPRTPSPAGKETSDASALPSPS